MTINELIEKLKDIAIIHGGDVPVRVATVDYSWTYATAEHAKINTNSLNGKFVDISGIQHRHKPKL